MADKAARMLDRQAEKEEAVADIELCISAIEEQQRELDQWERFFLVEAISMLFHGAYDFARANAAFALVPPDDRSLAPSLPSDPLFDAWGIDRLRRALREAEAEPVPPRAHLGPIVFSGGARE